MDTRELDEYRNPMTDDAGRCTIDALVDGEYYLGIHHEDFLVERADAASIKLPADDGKEIQFRMRPAGKIQGTVANLGAVDTGRISFHLLLRPAPAEGKGSAAESAPGGEPGAQPAEPRAGEQWVWINPGDGAFRQGSLQPGTYQVFLQKPEFSPVKDGAPAEARAEPVLLDTVEIEAGKTKSLNLRAP